MCGLNRFSVSVKDIPKEELETALCVLLRSFNVCSLLIQKHSRGGGSSG